ncbi:outer membrane protein [Vibrio orientalis CIP 102891 = ATCC 33934]|uniref:Outer membrane protein n=1 Tax=Vibrio orientalis CIP 102891 = ATCC 33934 TaxID=675816 RepID=C9QEN2_VIBOR|nr:TolC family protein [Vibrio orientalis]EEX94505.1 putative outer membrane protein [Vibrio orientalis CIP 102891 = ATCC 33934]EGU53944.1 outer membrane protein [Vibrio orientalis CIP 102891 = ATCC 33934]
MLLKLSKPSFAILSLLGLSACTVVGPDFTLPEQRPLPSDWSVEQTDSDSQKSQQKLHLWWQQFNDPTLNQLVEMASQQNLDLEAAGLRIVQARSLLGISTGLQYPQVQAVSGNLTRAYVNDQGVNNAGLSFDAGWEMDVWGKYARGIESAEASYYASVASYHDIMVTITSEVARNYINYRTFQERLLLSRRNIEIQQRVVNITQVQFDSGNVTELDVQQAKNQLFNTKAAMPSLEIAMKQSRMALSMLLGVLPSEIEALLSSERFNQQMADYEAQFKSSNRKPALSGNNDRSIVPHPPMLDKQVDANLVMRRPDLLVSEMQARAQSAKIGVAETALYPNFSLFGSIGIDSTVPDGNSFSFSDSLTMAIGPTFQWNIFQYGRVKNNIRFEDARFQETLTNYNKKVLQAVNEVTNALDAYDLYLKQQSLRLQSVNSSIRAYNISMTQYENGQISFQRLLSSVEKMTRAEDSYASIKGNVANQVIALYKALGGGWEAQTGKAFLSEPVAQQMIDRNNWGGDLDEPGRQLPEIYIEPPAKKGQQGDSQQEEQQ